MGLVLEAAGLAFIGGAALPGLHAEEGGAGLGPEGNHGEVLEVQGDAPAGFPVLEADGFGPEALENQGVQALEGGIVQGDLPTVEHGLRFAASEEALGGEKEGVCVLGLVKNQFIVLEAFPFKQGAADGGMGPDAEGQWGLAGVLHGEGGGKAVCEELVPDLEDEGEGEAGQGFRALPELQDGVVRTLIHGGECALPGETVAAHFKGPTADVRFAVL